MANRSRSTFLKRQRERRKAEKAAEKRAKKHGKPQEGFAEPQPDVEVARLFRPRVEGEAEAEADESEA